MTYSARSRDRYRVVASVTTGAVAAACLAGTGAVMGTAAAANTQSQLDVALALERELNAQPIVIDVDRPTAKVTRIKVVAKPGAGPTIRVVRSGTRTSSTGSRSNRAAPKPPTKSSGS